MKTKKEKITKKFVNNATGDGYFDLPADGYVKTRYADPGTLSSKTSTLSSANVIIRSDGNVIGAIQRFDFWESNNQGVFGVCGQCSRVCFDKMNILEAFSGQPHLKPAKKFDIEIIYQYPGETVIWDVYGPLQYTGPCVVLEGVEITNRHTYFDVKESVVVEDICFTAESITSIRKANK